MVKLASSLDSSCAYKGNFLIFQKFWQENEKFVSVIEGKLMGMFSKEERRSNKVIRVRRNKNEESKNYTIGHALRHNRTKTCRFES